MMIEIVKFDRKDNRIEIGFRQGKAVVYASVPSDLTDSEAKQKAYEQVRKALEYEQTLNKPSFVVLDNVDEEGNVIPFEIFNPAEPKVNKIEIIGDRFIHFEKGQDSVTKEYAAKITDQYGEPIEKDVIWYGAENGVLTVNHEQQEIEVKAECDGVESSILVQVFPYVEPQPTAEEKISQLETALIETTVLLETEQEKNAQNEQVIMELSALIAGGNA